ncbi:hypothetical protein BKI52_17015 [marine bacterium AO1-C]|nr:hypothetical protein BKI52_17015 [marine bacterium AO1-C]
MIEKITPAEAHKLAIGAEEFPVMVKEENEQSESAVCLKKFPTGFVLGISCDTKDLFELYFSENYELIKNKCDFHIGIMKTKGHPFESIE